MPAPRNDLHRRAIVGTARFLTFSCYRRLPLFNNAKIKDAFASALTATTFEPHADMLAWVVMPEHVHLIVYVEHADGADPVPDFLHALKRPIARVVMNRWRRLNAPILGRLRDDTGITRFWQPGGGYDRNVVGEQLIEKIRYVHANPITRGLSPTSCGWPWSSSRAYLHRPDAIGPPIAFDLVPPHKGDLTRPAPLSNGKPRPGGTLFPGDKPAPGGETRSGWQGLYSSLGERKTRFEVPERPHHQGLSTSLATRRPCRRGTALRRSGMVPCLK